MHTIEIDGDTWEIGARGTFNPETGKTYCHLWSTTRAWKGVKRDTPVQMCDWIDLAAHGID